MVSEIAVKVGTALTGISVVDVTLSLEDVQDPKLIDYLTYTVFTRLVNANKESE
jgi:hypothetical protein